MNIVLSTNRFLPYSTGGAEILALGLAHVYQSMGHQASILCTEMASAGDSATVAMTHESVAGIPVDRMWMSSTGRETVSWTGYDSSLAPMIKQVVDDRQPVILHALAFGRLSAVVLDVANQAGCKLFYTACGYELTCSLIELIHPDNTLCDGKASLRRCLACRRPHTPQSELAYYATRWLPEPALLSVVELWHRIGGRLITLFEMLGLLAQRNRVMRNAISKLHGVIAPSEWSRQVLLQNGVAPEKISVVHHGVQEEVCASVHQPTESGLRFGFIGRITPIKGVDRLIRAFLRVPSHLKTSLVIFGPVSDHDQDYFRACQALASDCPAIRFGGPLDRSQVAGAFATIDVLVVPSVWHEVLGIVIQEALANKTPVIAAAIGGVPDLIQHDVNGWLYPPFDEDALLGLLQDCSANPAAVVEAQRKIGPPRTVQAEAQELLAIYESAL